MERKVRNQTQSIQGHSNVAGFKFPPKTAQIGWIHLKFSHFFWLHLFFCWPCAGYNDKTPPFSSGYLEKMQSSDLKTVLGTLRFARVPRTVFEVLGLHLSQDPSEKGGVLAQVIFMDKCLSFHRRGFLPASCMAFRAAKTHFLISKF